MTQVVPLPQGVDVHKFAKAVELLRPEAKEMVDMAMTKPMTTQDGYAKIWKMVGDLQKSQGEGFAKVFLAACVREGYPATTGHQIAQLMGWLDF